MTLNNEEFLIKVIINGNDRYILFRTVANLKYLERSKIRIIDGTFFAKPRQFKQIYTIHGLVEFNDNKKVVPLVYCLMTKKSEIGYTSVFSSFCPYADQHGINLEPDFILSLSDFEKAAINACNIVFEKAVTKGCFFHFCQSIYKQVEQLGFQNRFIQEKTFYLLIKKVMALTFLPQREIATTFLNLKLKADSESVKFFKWFQKYYIFSQSSRLYDPKFWSVEELFKQNYPRTTNHAEAWHRRFKELVTKSHVGLLKIIEEFEKEQNYFEIDIIRMQLGHTINVQNKQKLKEKNLLKIYNQKNFQTLDEYLSSLALII